ncbi:collagen alpha-2(I) chain-like [Anser cygnoides]|uniref:collagen alpha-2(I) chain-like n=1 Tax=Anser cygnoides TaxID=8845 RepID=UPI0034D1780A
MGGGRPRRSPLQLGLGACCVLLAVWGWALALLGLWGRLGSVALGRLAGAPLPLLHLGGAAPPRGGPGGPGGGGGLGGLDGTAPAAAGVPGGPAGAAGGRGGHGHLPLRLPGLRAQPGAGPGAAGAALAVRHQPGGALTQAWDSVMSKGCYRKLLGLVRVRSLELGAAATVAAGLQLVTAVLALLLYLRLQPRPAPPADDAPPLDDAPPPKPRPQTPRPPRHRPAGASPDPPNKGPGADWPFFSLRNAPAKLIGGGGRQPRTRPARRLGPRAAIGPLAVNHPARA